MPNLGELRRGILSRVRGGKAEEPAEEALPNAVKPDGDDGPADDAQVSEFVDLFRDQLERRRPPAGPIGQPWSFGLGTVLAEHSAVPKRLRGAVGRLDRFGGVAVTPQGISFDGDEAEWVDVTELRIRYIADYLLSDAIQQQLRSVPLPPFPGRRRLMDALGRAMLTVIIAATENGLADQGLHYQIPAEIAHRGRFGREKIMSVGVLGALAMADPAVKECVIESAQARGVLVKPTEEEEFADAVARAAAIKQKVAALRAQLDRFGRGRD